VGKSSGGGSQDAGDDNVGEKHFEYTCRVDESGGKKDCVEKKVSDQKTVKRVSNLIRD
jgi:hypothetical protein